jgi:hypothetical protein
MSRNNSTSRITENVFFMMSNGLETHKARLGWKSCVLSYYVKYSVTSPCVFQIWNFTCICKVYSFINSVICLTISPLSLPKRLFDRLRYFASPFNFQYRPFSFMSYSSCIRLILCLPLTSTFPSIFPSITCFIKHALRNFLLYDSNFLFILLWDSGYYLQVCDLFHFCLFIFLCMVLSISSYPRIQLSCT